MWIIATVFLMQEIIYGDYVHPRQNDILANCLKTKH